MQDVKKLDMATQQLEDALRAYFDGHYHSALVLAAASEQLLAGYMHLHDLEPAFSSMRRTIVKIANGLKNKTGEPVKPTSEKDIGDLLNRAYNHSHHAGKSNLEIRMNPRFEAQETIDRAISNFDALSSKYNLPELQLAQAFVLQTIQNPTLETDVTEALLPLAQGEA